MLHGTKRDSDEALLERLTRSDPEAAAELFRRYGRRVRALARAKCGADLAARLDAEDIVQSVFRTFFHDAARGGYQLVPGAGLWNLLATITVNAVGAEGEFHRAAKRDVRATRIPSRGLELYRRDGQEQEVLELRLLIGDVVEQLHDRDRRIVQLRLEGHLVEDIVQLTGTSRRTVERVLKSFREIMREKLRAAT